MNKTKKIWSKQNDETITKLMMLRVLSTHIDIMEKIAILRDVADDLEAELQLQIRN